MLKLRYSIFIIFSILIAENIQAEEIKEYEKKIINIDRNIELHFSLEEESDTEIIGTATDPEIDSTVTIPGKDTPPILAPTLEPSPTEAPTSPPTLETPSPEAPTLSKQILEAPQKYTVYLMDNSLTQYNEMLSKEHNYPVLDNWKINASLLGSNANYSGYGNEFKSTGAFLTSEYRLTEISTLGVAFQGVNQHLDFENPDKLESINFVVGAFNRNKFKNFELNTGVSYQFGKYKASRYENEIDNKSSYDSNSFSATVAIKREISILDDLFLIPKLGMRYSYFLQDEIEEDNNITGIRFNSKNYDNLNTEFGIGIKKIIHLQNGTLEFEPNLSYTYSKNNMNKDLEGKRISNNEKIFIKKLENEKHIGKISFDVQYKKSNNIFISSGISYSNSDAKNSDMNIHLGIGYKFNTIEDFNFFNKEKIIKTFVLDTKTRFDFNSSSLNNENKNKIEEISKAINNIENDISIKVIGHTDNIGTKEYNKKLSEQRAKNVVEEFGRNITKQNISYFSQGNGFDTPISTNETEIGRALNRRVEINIIEN